MKIYLAGPINGCTDEEALGWRAVARARLDSWGHLIHDPMQRDYRGRELAFGQVRRLVESDKNAIAWCDAVLAHCPRPSAGTSMEILYAYDRRKLIHAVVPVGVSVSPWIAYHADTVSTLLYEALMRFAPTVAV